MAYTTLDRVLNQLRGSNAYTREATPNLLMRYVRDVTNRAGMYGYDFEPYYKVKPITPSGSNIDSRLMTLNLDEMLLEPTAIVVNGQTGTFGSDILPYPNDGYTPIRTLRIANPTAGPIRTWYWHCRQGASVSPIESIQITGFWGYRRWYAAQGWMGSLTQTPALNPTQSSFDVEGANVPDWNGDTPLFSPGNLLRFDDEMAEVVTAELDDMTHIASLTVRRGWRGTAPVAHAEGTEIKIWNIEDSIQKVATTQCGLIFARRGSYHIMTLPDGSSITYPADLLEELIGTIRDFDYVR